MQSFRLKNSHKAKAFSHAIALLDGRRNHDMHARQTDLYDELAGDVADLIRRAVPGAIETVLEFEGLVRETRIIDAGHLRTTLCGRWSFDRPWAVARTMMEERAGGADLLALTTRGCSGDDSGSDTAPDARPGPDLYLPYAVKVYDRVGRSDAERGFKRCFLPRSDLPGLLSMSDVDGKTLPALAGIVGTLDALRALNAKARSNLADVDDLFAAFDACQTSDELAALFPASTRLFEDPPAHRAPSAASTRILHDLG